MFFLKSNQNKKTKKNTTFSTSPTTTNKRTIAKKMYVRSKTTQRNTIGTNINQNKDQESNEQSKPKHQQTCVFEDSIFPCIRLHQRSWGHNLQFFQHQKACSWSQRCWLHEYGRNRCPIRARFHGTRQSVHVRQKKIELENFAKNACVFFAPTEVVVLVFMAQKALGTPNTTKKVHIKRNGLVTNTFVVHKGWWTWVREKKNEKEKNRKKMAVPKSG